MYPIAAVHQYWWLLHVRDLTGAKHKLPATQHACIKIMLMAERRIELELIAAQQRVRWRGLTAVRTIGRPKGFLTRSPCCQALRTSA